LDEKNKIEKLEKANENKVKKLNENLNEDLAQMLTFINLERQKTWQKFSKLTQN